MSELLAFSSTHTPPASQPCPLRYPLSTTHYAPPTGPSPPRRLLLLLSSTKHTRPVLFYLKLSPFSTTLRLFSGLVLRLSPAPYHNLFFFIAFQQHPHRVACCIFFFSFLDERHTLVSSIDRCYKRSHTKASVCDSLFLFGISGLTVHVNLGNRNTQPPAVNFAIYPSVPPGLVRRLSRLFGSASNSLTENRPVTVIVPACFIVAAHPDLTYRTAFCPSFVQTHNILPNFSIRSESSNIQIRFSSFWEQSQKRLENNVSDNNC